MSQGPKFNKNYLYPFTSSTFASASTGNSAAKYVLPTVTYSNPVPQTQHHVSRPSSTAQDTKRDSGNIRDREVSGRGNFSMSGSSSPAPTLVGSSSRSGGRPRVDGLYETTKYKTKLKPLVPRAARKKETAERQTTDGDKGKRKKPEDWKELQTNEKHGGWLCLVLNLNTSGGSRIAPLTAKSVIEIRSIDYISDRNALNEMIMGNGSTPCLSTDLLASSEEPRELLVALYPYPAFGVLIAIPIPRTRFIAISVTRPWSFHMCELKKDMVLEDGPKYSSSTGSRCVDGG
ncbi:hypothetical protein BCON_0001g00950 [Botryotinia convoluta]|uniref:Uncharacterized protein n=1 Tax=Botryotinia convoluta TaxID=54673 RepID=A0A4Z1IWC3_9HELO|nr:hypothetical protein BCON_0001g00950 [Botryotinia convoluta]